MKNYQHNYHSLLISRIQIISFLQIDEFSFQAMESRGSLSTKLRYQVKQQIPPEQPSGLQETRAQRNANLVIFLEYNWVQTFIFTLRFSANPKVLPLKAYTFKGLLLVYLELPLFSFQRNLPILNPPLFHSHSF